MELDDTEKLEAKFTKLAEEVNAILDRIKRREAKEALRRKREIYSAPRPRNIFNQLPGRQGFEYIKVPKLQSDLSFGSKTDRTVFPDVPGVIVKHEQTQYPSSKSSRETECKPHEQPRYEQKSKKSQRLHRNSGKTLELKPSDSSIIDMKRENFDIL